jgi:hypothetical protein
MEIIEEKVQGIAKEMEEAGATQWNITRIVKILSEMNTTSEKKLREKTLEMLKELDPTAAGTYERFSRMKVYLSAEKIFQFNRGNIITSLLKETNISRTAAEKITTEVENQIKDTKIDFLTPSLIRELVNAKLISYGFEEVRNNYARIGEAVYDVKKKLEKEPVFGETAREYNLLTQIEKTERELHYDGTICIEDTEGFSQRAHAISIIAEKKEDYEKTIYSAFKKANLFDRYFYIPTSIYGLTHACSSEVKTDKNAKNIAQMINRVEEILEKKHLLSLELYTPKEFEKSASNKINASKISNELLGENTVVGIDSKYSLKLIQTKGKHFSILNNEEEQYYPFDSKLFSTTPIILMKIGLNLEKIAQSVDEDKFFEKLKDISEHINKLKETKKNLLQKREYLKQFDFTNAKTCIGITNLYTLSENFNKKPIEFAPKVYKELSKLFDNDLICGSSKKATLKFSENLGKEVYPQDTFIFDECLKEKKCCFTGKAANLNELNELLTKKVKQVEYMGFE